MSFPGFSPYNFGTVCGLLDSIKGKLDDMGGDQADSGSGQLMAFINEPTGRICSWGIPLAEAYGVRLPVDYAGEVPKQMQLMDAPEEEPVNSEKVMPGRPSRPPRTEKSRSRRGASRCAPAAHISTLIL